MRTTNLAPLADPIWWTALAVLVFNDHLLKGSSVLPAVVTGKLSDVAGMIVAPVLLVALAGARSPRARAACFAAVGGAFAAIKCSGLAATWLTVALSLLGLRWRIWVDPTDLVALLALPVAWRMTTPTRDALTRGSARRWMRPAGAVLGSCACLASGVGPAMWSTPAYMVNASYGQLDVRLRYYDGDFSCADLNDFAPRAFAPSSFGEGITFHLAAWETLPLDRQSVNAAAGLTANNGAVMQPEPCEVVLLQADGLPDTLVWWADLSPLEVPLRATDPAFAENRALAGGRIDVGPGGGRAMSARPRGELRTANALPTAPKAGCVAAPAFQWSEPPGFGVELSIASLAALPDGCLDMQLVPPGSSGGSGGAGGGAGGGSGGGGGAGEGGAGGAAAGTGGAGEEPGVVSRLLLCIPPGVMPFQAGDVVVLEVPPHTATAALRIRGDAGDVLVYWGETQLPLATGTNGTFRRAECEGDRTACGGYAIPLALELASGEVLQPGGKTIIDAPDGTTKQLLLGRAEEVLVTRGGCEQGRDALGARADLVIVSTEGGSR